MRNDRQFNDVKPYSTSSLWRNKVVGYRDDTPTTLMRYAGIIDSWDWIMKINLESELVKQWIQDQE